MENTENRTIEYFFGRTVKPGETSTVALMFRELALTNVALRTIGKGETMVKGIIDGQEFLIANLSKNHPHHRVDFKFTKDCVFVSFEVTGDQEVDITGYVIGLDSTKMLSLKEAMELSDKSDDEEYREESASPNKDDIDSENDSDFQRMMVEEEERMMNGDYQGDSGDELEEDSQGDSGSKLEGTSQEDSGSESEQPPSDEAPRDAINFNAQGYRHIGKFIKYKDIHIGEGNVPTMGHRIAIQYKLTIPTGEVIDSENPDDFSRLPFPTAFRLGLGSVVSGLNKGIQTMRIGGVRELLISPEMGFGDKGSIVADIRPGESFIVEVHLL